MNNNFGFKTFVWAIIPIVVIVGLVTSAPVFAKDKGDILIRLRALSFNPDVDGTTDQFAGSANVDSTVIPELDISYFFTDNIAAELILATTKNRVKVDNSTLGDLNLGTVRLLPPTLSLQYHFLPKGRFSPYVGAGINGTFFYDVDAGSQFTDVDYTHTLGYAFQAGLDAKINDKWSVNLDVKKFFIDTDITVSGGTATAPDTDLDPWVIGVGFGFAF
jgi:outer membrane protein